MAATHIIPGESSLNRDLFGPIAKGKKVITIRKKTKGIKNVADFLKDKIRSLLRTSKK